MIIQECFELLDDVDCISATLNTVAYGSNGCQSLLFKYKKMPSLATYGGPLDQGFCWAETEEGHEYWHKLDQKLMKLCAKK